MIEAKSCTESRHAHERSTPIRGCLTIFEESLVWVLTRREGPNEGM